MKHDMVARRESVLRRLSGYVESRLLPALGVAGAPFRLSAAPEGTRSIVLFLDVGGRRYVLKCYEEIVRATATVLATRHLVRRGAPVPKLVQADLSPVTRLRLGVFVLVEEFVDGRNLYEIGRSPERLASAGRVLARLHAITRRRWGPLLPGMGRRAGYFDDIHARLTRRLDDLVTEMEGFEALGRTEIRDWLAAQRKSGLQRGGYSLSHLRVTQTNILFTDDDEARLIDVVTARYAHHAVDLERALQRWCGRKEERREVFLAAYFDALPNVTRAEWEEVRPYHRASFHLTQAYRAAKELRRFLELGKPAKSRRRRRTLDRHVRRFLRTIAEANDAPPAEVLAETRRSVLDAARALRAKIPGTKGVGSGDAEGAGDAQGSKT